MAAPKFIPDARTARIRLELAQTYISRQDALAQTIEDPISRDEWLGVFAAEMALAQREIDFCLEWLAARGLDRTEAICQDGAPPGDRHGPHLL